MPLGIDFSPARTDSRTLAFLAAGLIVAMIGIWDATTRLGDLKDIQQQANKSQTTREQSVPKFTPAQVEAINQAVRQLNVPWGDLFAEIEGRMSDRVSLLSLEPDVSSQRLRIVGEAKSADDMLDFLADLGKGPALSLAILNHHEINEADRNRPVRFLAEVPWLIQ